MVARAEVLHQWWLTLQSSMAHSRSALLPHPRHSLPGRRAHRCVWLCGDVCRNMFVRVNMVAVHNCLCIHNISGVTFALWEPAADPLCVAFRSYTLSLPGCFPRRCMTCIKQQMASSWCQRTS